VLYSLIAAEGNWQAAASNDHIDVESSPNCGHRCHACRAEARHKSTAVDENANGNVKLYSEAVKTQKAFSPSTKSSLVVQESVYPTSEMEPTRELRAYDQKEIASSVNRQYPDTMNSLGVRNHETGSQCTRKLRAVSSSKSKPLRAEAASFVPDWASNTPNETNTALEDAAQQVYEHYGPAPVEMLIPNCPPVGSQNGLHLTMPNFECDRSLHHEVYGNEYDIVNYHPGDNTSPPEQYTWCTLTPRVYTDQDVLGNDEYKVQTANPRPVAEQIQCTSEASALKPSPRRLSIASLKKMQDQMSTRIVEAQIAEQMRKRKEIELGPGPYPHIVCNTSRPLTENMWMPPISPGHQYTGLSAMPNPRSREWEELANAIKLINLDYSQRNNRAQKWWEPPIPMGFDRRTRFNQPLQPATPLGAGKNEWDWVNIPLVGCNYCGADHHTGSECTLRRRHGENNYERCLNCNDKDHYLRDCLSLPVFDNEWSRTKKLQHYAHTEHWRQVLHKQHSQYVNGDDSTAATGSNGNEYPELRAGMGDPSVAFSWLNCSPCKPEVHWDAIQSNVSVIQRQSENLAAETSSSSDENVEAYWKSPEWLLEYKNCPVMWNLMHKQDPRVSWAVFNPLNSVAVDAFWRTGIRAMGWDAPDLPDVEGLKASKRITW
jgi:hypothetical protein